MADSLEVRVPDIGDFDAVEIIELLIKAGDHVEVEDPLITLESDKATMDVPAPAAGTVETIAVAVGDRVSQGDLIAVLVGDDPGLPVDERPPEELTVRQPRPPLASALTEFTVVVPELGDFSDVDVIEVLVAAGDAVEVEQGLITLETDKATMDVPAPKAGTVTDVMVAVGDKVSAGDVVLSLRTSEEVQQAGGEAAPAPAPPQELEPTAPGAAAPEHPPAAPAKPAPAALPAIDEVSFSKAHASPSVRKLARELGVDLIRVRGSGLKGRITADDVKGYVKSVLQGDGVAKGLPNLPTVDFAKFGEIDVQPLSRIQKISGPRLHASWLNVPHVTQHDEADVTDLEATRQSLKSKAVSRGIKLTPLAFVVRACVLTLQEFPQFKASLAADGQSLVFKHYCHIGFAADTPGGLVVPVIREADKMDIYELAEALGTLSTAAREGRLKPTEMQGGVFTVSSLGGIGGTAFTPIINAPEVAILGVSRMRTSPVYIDGAFLPRLMLPLSLSYDHRVIDGAAAVRFTTQLAETLGDLDRLIEAIP